MVTKLIIEECSTIALEMGFYNDKREGISASADAA